MSIDRRHEVSAHTDGKGGLFLSSSTPEGIVGIEMTFPCGVWMEDEDGVPMYYVPVTFHGEARGIRQYGSGWDDEPSPEAGPPYDAATATGMYDHD